MLIDTCVVTCALRASLRKVVSVSVFSLVARLSHSYGPLFGLFCRDFGKGRD